MSAFLPPPWQIPPRGPGKTTPRQRVLTQWRRVDLAPLETAQANGAKTAGALLSPLLSKLRIEHRRAEAEIIKVWNSLLDPDVVAHAQPTGLRKGTLFVAIDSNAWLNEIVRYRRHEILDRLRHSFGQDLITKISFRVGP
ncbi:conserved hypothetical protein [Verrucomicrobia bacterium]|nr:conserved hypothetical protein [Verrucomicrobiota bacterium]